MKIGLIQIDGKIPNLALMKLAAFHKSKGDNVEIIDISSFEFDRIYELRFLWVVRDMILKQNYHKI